LATEGTETANIGDKKPAGDIFDFPRSSLHDVRFVRFRNRHWLPDFEDLVTNCDLIAVAKSNRVMNSALVQKGSVATAKIDQPKLTDIL
jgi:hypothetical protein